MLSYIWRKLSQPANMPHVASGTVAELLRSALDEEALGVRTLARRIVDENGGNVDSWRSQLHRILKGQSPERQTSITIARALQRPDDYLLSDPIVFPAPVALMQEVLENQAAILGRLEALEGTVDEATQQVAEALARMASAVEAIEVRSGSRPAAKQAARRAAR